MLKSNALDIREIHPLTDFLRNSKTHIAHLKKTGSPEILTVNGKAEVVVLDALRYQELLDRLERAELVTSMRQSLAQIQAGEGISLEALEAELGQSPSVK